MKQQIENIIKKNLPEKTDERRVATFGEWEAETYEEKMLVNAVLDQINISKIADEVLKVVVEKIEKLRKTKTFPQQLIHQDHSVEYFERLSDGDIHFRYKSLKIPKEII